MHPTNSTELDNPAFYAEVDLSDILRKASYLSEDNKNHNHYHPHQHPVSVQRHIRQHQQQHPWTVQRHNHHNHHHNPQPHQWTVHRQNHYQNYQPQQPHHQWSATAHPKSKLSYPLPLVLPNSSVTVNQSQQRLRNEMIASLPVATLPSIYSTDSIRPLKQFWEVPFSDIDADSVGPTDTKTKSKTFWLCSTLLVLCLALVFGVSVITYIIVNKNGNLWNESKTSEQNNNLSNIESEFLDNQQRDERLERGSKIILGEFTISNRQYSPALHSLSTPEYETLASDVVNSMNEMFFESPLARIYNLTQVNEFSESDTKVGVVVKCRISLNIVLLTAAQEVGLTFINALERRHGRLPAGNLRVDIRTIKFTDMTTNVTQVFDMSSNDPAISDTMHANRIDLTSDLKQSKLKITKTDFTLSKTVGWDLNESSRSLFIALSTARPGTQLSNDVIPVPNTPGKEETDSPLVVREEDEGKDSAKARGHGVEVKSKDVKAMVEEVVDERRDENVETSSDKSNNGNAFWSNWSEWSPCRGLNSKCDSGRIHSRIRKCMAPNGELLNSDICRANNAEQQELEIRDCRCESKGEPINASNMTDLSTPGHSDASVEQTDRACNDCKENEICLLQVKAKVPFCAKIKDSRDPRGCGGWCSGHKELCRYVGAQTYQCVDDSECLEDEWQCANGLCIPESRRCDGHFNCFDMSDEMHCNCKDDEFHCGNKTSCLPLSQRCDGIIHCWDGEDEQNCTKMCNENQFTCNSGQCIQIDSFCDTRKHCDDGSDEPDGCNGSVCKSKDDYQCRNGRCVSKHVLCDSIDNCGDNSDEEIDCKTVSNNRSKMTKNDGSVVAKPINN